MALDRSPQPNGLARELGDLCRALVQAERERERRLEAKLAELDAWIAEASRVHGLITGGAARREARLRALEEAVEEMAERFPALAPRPLDLPRRSGFDPTVVDMDSPERAPSSDD